MQPTDLEPTSCISNSPTPCPPTTSPWVVWTYMICFAPEVKEVVAIPLLVFIGLGNCEQLCFVQWVVNQANEEEEVLTSWVPAGAHHWVQEGKEIRARHDLWMPGAGATTEFVRTCQCTIELQEDILQVSSYESGSASGHRLWLHCVQHASV